MEKTRGYETTQSPQLKAQEQWKLDVEPNIKKRKCDVEENNNSKQFRSSSVWTDINRKLSNDQISLLSGHLTDAEIYQTLHTGKQASRTSQSKRTRDEQGNLWSSTNNTTRFTLSTQSTSISVPQSGSSPTKFAASTSSESPTTHPSLSRSSPVVLTRSPNTSWISESSLTPNVIAKLNISSETNKKLTNSVVSLTNTSSESPPILRDHQTINQIDSFTPPPLIRAPSFTRDEMSRSINFNSNFHSFGNVSVNGTASYRSDQVGEIPSIACPTISSGSGDARPELVCHTSSSLPEEEFVRETSTKPQTRNERAAASEVKVVYLWMETDLMDAFIGKYIRIG